MIPIGTSHSARVEGTLDAAQDLKMTAKAFAEMATCPACGRHDEKARRLTHVLGAMVPIGLVLFGFAADSYSDGLRGWHLRTIIAAAFAAWVSFSFRWRWTGIDQRVSFVKRP